MGVKKELQKGVFLKTLLFGLVITGLLFLLLFSNYYKIDSNLKNDNGITGSMVANFEEASTDLARETEFNSDSVPFESIESFELIEDISLSVNQKSFFFKIIDYLTSKSSNSLTGLLVGSNVEGTIINQEIKAPGLGILASNHTNTDTDGLIVYSLLNQNSYNYREWNATADNDFEGQLNAESVAGGSGGSALRFVEVEAAHDVKEFFALKTWEAKWLTVQSYVDSGWRSDVSHNISSATGSSILKIADIAVEQISNEVLIVYENTSLNDNILYYRTLIADVLSEEIELTLTGVDTTYYSHINLEARPFGDEITLVAQGKNGGAIIALWNGTDFTSQIENINYSSKGQNEEVNFKWEGNGSANGLLFWFDGVAGGVNYSEYSLDNGLGGESGTIELSDTGATLVRHVKMCASPLHENIGIIFMDDDEDVNVRIWNGSNISEDFPDEETAGWWSEGSNAIAVGLACSWFNSSAALFTYIDSSFRQRIKYFYYDTVSNWSVAAIDDAVLSENISGEIRNIGLDLNPALDEIVVTITTATGNLYVGIYNETNITFVGSGIINESLENTVFYDVDFKFDQLDTGPSVQNVLPIDYNFTTSDIVEINVSVTDDLGIYEVYADVVIPNGSTKTIILLDSENDDTYYANFSDSDITGDYNITVVAMDALGHNNTVEQTGNFSILADGSDECDTLNSDYTVTDSFNVSGTCFIINASNIILDGNNTHLEGDSTGFAIEIGNNSNVTIQNFSEIFNFSRGVSIDVDGDNTTIQNVVINLTEGEAGIFSLAPGLILNRSTIECNCSGTNNGTIRLKPTSSDMTLEKNVLIASGTHNLLEAANGDGHYVQGNDFYAIDGNALELNDSSSYGVYLENNVTAAKYALLGGGLSNFTANNFTSLSDENFSSILVIGNLNRFVNNKIESGFYSVLFGSENYEAQNNVFINNSLLSEAFTVVYFQNGTNNDFTNDTFAKNSATDNEVVIFQNSHTFTNVTFDIDNLSFDANANGSLLVKWYLDVNVSDNNGVPLNASVNVYNVSNSSVNTGSGGADGLIQGIEVNEVLINSSGRYYQTPHIVEATLNEFNSTNSTFNLTTTKSYNVTILMTNTTVCDTITLDTTLSDNVNSEGTCFTVIGSNLVIDLAGYNVTGDGVGFAIDVGNASNVTVKNGAVINFLKVVSAHNVTYLNISNISVLNSINTAFEFYDVNHSVIEGSSASLVSVSLNLSKSYNNTIQNNLFNATSYQAEDDGNNSYNISYSCSDNFVNILGGNCTGGNYWVDYSGSDSGAGSLYSHDNISGDGIGDTKLPFDDNDRILSPNGDYLPLVFCTESWTCGNWQACSGSTQSRECTDSNSCGTSFSRPIVLQDCGGSSGGSSSNTAPADPAPSDAVANPESGPAENKAPPKQQAKQPKRGPPGSVSYVPRKPGQVVGPINAKLPPKELIFKAEEAKEFLQVGLIKTETVEVVPSQIVQEAIESESNDAIAGGAITDSISDSEGSTESSSSTSESQSSGQSSGQSSSGGQGGGDGGQASQKSVARSDSTITKKAAAVIDNSYDARRSAELAREKLTLSLDNSGDKYIVLKPVAVQEVEETKPVITRKVYSGDIGEQNPLKVSAKSVSPEMLSASLGAIDRIVLEPGSSEQVELEVSGGFGTTSDVPISVSFFSEEDGEVSGDELFSQKVELKRQVVTTSSVVPNEEENSVDVFAVIIQSNLEDTTANLDGKTSETSEAITGAITGAVTGTEELIDAFDPYSGLDIYGGQYLEISLRDVSKSNELEIIGKFSIIPNMIFGANSNVLFTDVYGPYDINTKLSEGDDSSKEGFVFAQKFTYDPDLLQSGKYLVEMVISDSRGILSTQSFLLDLDKENNLQELIESEIEQNLDTSNNLETENNSLENGETELNNDGLTGAITGAIITDMTGAVTFSDFASVAYEQTGDAAYIIYEDVIPNQEAKIAFMFLLALIGLCLLVFVLGPIRPVFVDTLCGVKEHMSKFRKDLNA